MIPAPVVDREAYFGRYRLYRNGVDVRGYWQRSDALSAAREYRFACSGDYTVVDLFDSPEAVAA